MWIARTNKASKYRLLSIIIDFYLLLLLSITIDGSLSNASNKCSLKSKQAFTSSACCPLSAEFQFSCQILLLQKLPIYNFRGRDVPWQRKDKSTSRRLFADWPTQHVKFFERSALLCHKVVYWRYRAVPFSFSTNPISNRPQGRAFLHAIR